MIIGMEHFKKSMERLALTDLERPTHRAIMLVQAAAKDNVHVVSGELRESIYTDVRKMGDKYVATCFTNKAYAAFVEFGTGPKGQKNHAGISPEVAVAYRQSPWWIHESMVDKETAEKYHWFSIKTKEGTFYQCTGQPAYPYMYPAMKNNHDKIVEIYEDHLSGRKGSR